MPGEFVTRGLGRHEVNRRNSLIRKIFKWGVATEIVEPSFLHGLQALDGLRRGRMTAPDTGPVRPVRSFSDRCNLPYIAPAVGVMVRLQELTGMRPNEVVQMPGCDPEYVRQHPGCTVRSTTRWNNIGMSSE